MKDGDLSYSNINWNNIWKKQMQSNDSMLGNKKCVNYFDNIKAAKKYNDMIQKSDLYEFKDEFLNNIANIRNIENLRILDVGAGPGTHTVPLSKIAKEVTAVEPSKAMLSFLKDNLKANEINNVVCINETWEDIKLGENISNPYDIVIASFSLGMPDIESALRKMNEVSSGYVFLAWPTKISTWDKICIELWPQLHGEEYIPMPRVDCLINVLWQIGIYPNVSTYHKSKINEFPSIDEFLSRYGLESKIKTEKQKEVLKNYFREKMIEKDGKIVLSADEDYSIVWWKK